MANNTAFTSGRDLNSVSENVELLTGQRGNQLDKAVTYRDLESLGVATLSRIGSNYKATSNPVLTTTVGVVDSPTKPQNVQAHGAFNTILIDWDEPDYRGHSYAEVWRSETDNLSAAVKVGTTSARMYSDPIGGDASVYYWVRFVNANNVTGPFNSSAGTHAETAVDVQQLLDSLTGQIEESQLAQSLTEKIGLIDTNIASIQQINTNIKQIDVDFQQITVDLSSLSDRQAQAEAILKSAQDLLGSTTIDVALLHDQLSQQVQKYGADVQNLTNAILTVNPATGEVTIDAVNVVRTELQTSIDEVSQRVSSVEGTLTQKASSTDVTLQSQRISTVETKLDSINSELTNQVTRAEFTDTQEDVTQLTTRMSAAEGSISTKAEQQTVTNLSTRIASAETKLIAVNDDLTSKATQISGLQSSYQSASSDIAGNSEAIAANTASITELSQTITDNESATSQRLDGLDSSVSGMHSAITSLQQTTSNAIEATASNYSHLKAQTDLTALAAANAALSDDESSRSSRSSEASIRTNLKVLTSDHESLAKTVEVLQADFETETSSLSAQIATEQTTRSTAIESLSQQITTLDSSYKSSDATITASLATEQMARSSADTALSQQIAVVQSAVNDNAAAIQSEQTARVTKDEALSQQITTLTSEYKAADSTLSASIATEQTARTAADSALSQQISVVQSAVDGNTSAIQSEQTARTTADAALAQDIATLTASVGTNSAAIQSESTARSNADTALSSRIDTVQATANNLTSSVQTQSQAISTLENGAQAMWTAKTQVGQITAGIGVMTDSNGKSQVMISASQLFVFDPNSAAPTQSLFAVSDGKVVIQKAVIEKATIETVTAMSITADYVKAGVSLTSPNLVGGTLSIGSGDNALFLADGAIGIGKGGPYGGWGYGWHTIIYNDGGIYTDRLHASSGDFTGYVHATSGHFENVTIAENCNVLGTVYANKIVGDVVAIKKVNASISNVLVSKGGYTTITSFTVTSSSKTRSIRVEGTSGEISAGGSTIGNGYLQLLINGGIVASVAVAELAPNTVDGYYTIPTNTNAVVLLQLYILGTANKSYASGEWTGYATVVPTSSGTFA